MWQKLITNIQIFFFYLKLKLQGLIFKISTGNLFTRFTITEQGEQFIEYCTKVIENPTYTYKDYAEMMQKEKLDDIVASSDKTRQQIAFICVTMMLGLTD